MRLAILFNIIQEGEVIFKKKFRVVLPEVSKLINSEISKRKGEQRKHSFLRKKELRKRVKEFTMNTQKYHIC